MIGRFSNGVGEFIGEDTLRGIPIRARFRWSAMTAQSALWEQAFTPKAGSEKWETSWTMHFTKVA